METHRIPTRAKRKLGLGLAAVVILGVAACSHHSNNSGSSSNNTMNNTTNNTTENATAEVFGTTFATDFSANANTDPANVSSGDVVAVSSTALAVPVNSMGAASTSPAPGQ